MDNPCLFILISNYRKFWLTFLSEEMIVLKSSICGLQHFCFVLPTYLASTETFFVLFKLSESE